MLIPHTGSHGALRHGNLYESGPCRHSGERFNHRTRNTEESKGIPVSVHVTGVRRSRTADTNSYSNK
jgi:hypothetical protein